MKTLIDEKWVRLSLSALTSINVFLLYLMFTFNSLKSGFLFYPRLLKLKKPKTTILSQITTFTSNAANYAHEMLSQKYFQ